MFGPRGSVQKDLNRHSILFTFLAYLQQNGTSKKQAASRPLLIASFFYPEDGDSKHSSP
jgi:hypothetical protein